jgi:hypothetical protein
MKSHLSILSVSCWAAEVPLRRSLPICVTFRVFPALFCTNCRVLGLILRFLTHFESILFIFSKKKLFVSLILCMVFFCFYFIDVGPYFYFSPACLEISLFLFFRSLRCSIRSLIWDLSVFLIYALMTIHFPLRTAFGVSHRFW